MNNFTLSPLIYHLRQWLFSILAVIISQPSYSQEKTTIAPARVQHKQLDSINNSLSVPGDENWDDRLGFPITRWEQSGHAIAVIDTEIYLGGSIPVINDVARWNINRWLPLSRNQFDGRVEALAAVGNDLYVGGLFVVIDSIVVNRIAKWNRLTQKWSVLKNDTSIGIDSHVEQSSNVNNVLAMTVRDHDLYIGGGFTYAGGIVANNIVKWNSLSNTWSPLGSGINGYVSAIAVLDGDVYVGGRFTLAGGVPANNIAKWNGRKWSALGSGVKGNVYAIAVFGKEVYVGGGFSEAGDVKANNIAKWSPTNNSWSALGGNGTNRGVLAIASNKKFVYVGGNVDLADGQKINGIAKWDPIGNQWLAMGSGVDGAVKSIVVHGNDVLVAGTILKVGGKDSKNFGIWHEPNEPPVIAALPELRFDEDKSLLYPFHNWYMFATDADDADSALTFDVLSGNHVKAARQATGYRFAAPANWFGKDTLQIIVKDPGQLADTTALMVTVNPVNDMPKISGLPDSLSFKKGASAQLNIWDFVEDVETPDRQLTYTFSTSNPLLLRKFDYTTGVLVLTAPQFHGRAQLFINVSDSKAGAQDTVAVRVELPTGVASRQEQIPADFVLSQNYPNPFSARGTFGNPTTLIRFGLPYDTEAKVEVLDLSGRHIATLLNERKPAGFHQVQFDARNLSTGLYFYRLTAGQFTAMKKLMLVQ